MGKRRGEKREILGNGGELGEFSSLSLFMGKKNWNAEIAKYHERHESLSRPPRPFVTFVVQTPPHPPLSV